MKLIVEDIETLKSSIRQKIKDRLDSGTMSITSLSKILGMNRSHVSDIINSDRSSLEKLLVVSAPLFDFELKVTEKKVVDAKDQVD